MRIRTAVSAVAVVVALFSAAGCNRGIRIAGKAMEPALMDDTFVSASRLYTSIDRGDIVAFRYPQDESKSFVKRVVGVPGDEISSIEGVVSVAGKPLDEPYVVAENRSHDSWGPITVPADQFFVMGDNRRNSSDSRHWGMVKREAVWGKVGR